MVADQLGQGLDEASAHAAWNRHAAELDRDRDHLRHEAGGRRVRTEAGVQDPWREQSVRTVGLERLGQPVARRLHERARELRETAPPEPAIRL